MRNKIFYANLLLATVLLVFAGTESRWGQPAPEPEKNPVAAPAPEKNPAPAAEPEKTKPAEKKVKRTTKLAEDAEETALPEKDPSSYQLSNKQLIAEYSAQDHNPYDRGE